MFMKIGSLLQNIVDVFAVYDTIIDTIIDSVFIMTDGVLPYKYTIVNSLTY